MTWVMPVECDQLLSRIGHRGVAGRNEGLDGFNEGAACRSLIGWLTHCALFRLEQGLGMSSCKSRVWYLGIINIGHDAR